MTAISFLVEVELDRDSGMFASRDELAEKFMDELASAEDNADLSSVGPNSDSSYSVSSFQITELEKKERKALNQEYDLAVATETPSATAQRQIQKEMKEEIKHLKLQNARLEVQLAEIAVEREKHATRVYQQNVGQGTPPTYFADGLYDHVMFQFGDEWQQRFSVVMIDNVLKVRTDTMGADFVVVPRSSNEIEVRMVGR